MTFTYETSRDNTPSVEAAVRGDSDIVTTTITVTDDGSNGTVDDATDDADDNNDGFGPGFGVAMTVAGLALLSPLFRRNC